MQKYFMRQSGGIIWFEKIGFYVVRRRNVFFRVRNRKGVERAFLDINPDTIDRIEGVRNQVNFTGRNRK